MRKITRDATTLLIAVFVTIIAGCHGNNEGDKYAFSNQRKQDFIIFIMPPGMPPSNGVHFEYKIGEMELKRLVAGVKQLQRGDSLERVRSVLGPAAKEVRSKRDDGLWTRHVDRFLTYPVRTVRVGSSNVFDQSIDIVVDESSGRISQILSTVPEIAGRSK
jgi:hypothetical protein